jgi:hypothetical protein
VAATCNNGGASNFKPELSLHFRGKRVAIFPDSDEPGRVHALQVAEILPPVAKPLMIGKLPALPAKGDVTDWVNPGGTLEALREFHRKAEPWTPECQFAVDVAAENEKYIRTIEQEVEAAAGAHGVQARSKTHRTANAILEARLDARRRYSQRRRVRDRRQPGRREDLHRSEQGEMRGGA